MSQTDHINVRQRLVAELEALHHADDAGAKGTQTVELDQQAVGRLSRMDALQNQAMAVANARMRAVRKAKIEAAIRRIDTDEYGYCSECGDTIEPKRLAIDPTVLTCVDCARG